jgi:cytochrome c-type biogenesis protein CcmH
MTLWFLLLVMTAGAVFAVLWPLGRRPAAPAGGHDLRVYRDQLEEIERDRAAGQIREGEAEAARIEISRRMLAAAEREPTTPLTTSQFRRRAVVVAAFVLLPLLSGGLYLVLGSPGLPGQPLYARVKSPEALPVEQLVVQIEQHLERNPKDGRGWEVLAPVYMEMGRFDDAVRARRNALTYNGETAMRESDLGEALAAQGKGVVTVDAKQAFQRALALDPREPKSRYYIGLAAQQDGRTADAVKIWRELLASAPSDAAWAGFVREKLANLDDEPPQASPGPSADEMAAAANMDPQQRQEMITGMVARLAERLKNDGGDLEGWMRLVRAYAVLGERDKARSAASDARRAVGHDGDKLRRLDELVKGLGLES